jgi:hypothetical protein
VDVRSPFSSFLFLPLLLLLTLPFPLPLSTFLPSHSMSPFLPPSVSILPFLPAPVPPSPLFPSSRNSCGGSIAIYYLIKRNSILFLHADKGAFHVPPFLDSHGEADVGRCVLLFPFLPFLPFLPSTSTALHFSVLFLLTSQSTFD